MAQPLHLLQINTDCQTDRQTAGDGRLYCFTPMFADEYA